MIYLIIIATIFAVDEGIKQYIVGHQEKGCDKEILGGHVIVTKEYNNGAFLNFLDKKKKVVAILSSSLLASVFGVLLWLLPKKGNHITKFGLAVTVGGAGSNIFDRWVRGHVVDYFSFKKLKSVVFNIGDLFIFLGAFLLMLVAFLKKK